MRTWLVLMAMITLVGFETISAEPRDDSEIQIEEISEEKIEQQEYEEEKKKDGLGDDFASNRLPEGILQEEIEEIDKAIDAGVAYLKSLQAEDGAFPIYAKDAYRVGGQALILLSLMKCGVDRDDQVITQGKQRLKAWYTQEQSRPDGVFTYSSGVILMFLEAYYTEKLSEKELEKARKKFEKKRETALKRKKEFNDVLETTRSLTPSGSDKTWIKELVTRLESTQDSATGTWGYPSNKPYGVVGSPGAWSNSVGQQLTGDLSNTQYALLGLKAASRMGIRVKNSDIYRKVAEFLISRQDLEGPKRQRWDIELEEDPEKARYRRGTVEQSEDFDHARGWAYPAAERNHITEPNEKLPQPIPRTGSMTTAALACLMISKSELEIAGDLEEKDEIDTQISRAVWDGFAWLDAAWDINGNPIATPNAEHFSKNPQWHYYYLYGLERAGMLASRDFVGQHEWYPEGARLLLKDQWEDGSWAKQRKLLHLDNAAETCYALLFLKRATSTKGFKKVQAPTTGRKH